MKLWLLVLSLVVLFLAFVGAVLFVTFAGAYNYRL